MGGSVFNVRGDVEDIYPHRWEIIKHVRMAPRPWRVHEEIQSKQVDKVATGMEDLGIFIAPIVAAYYRDMHYKEDGKDAHGPFTFIADGTHRTGASQKLGFRSLPINEMNYTMDKRVELYTWIRTIKKVDPKKFSTCLDNFNQNQSSPLIKMKRDEVKEIRREIDKLRDSMKRLDRVLKQRRQGHEDRAEKLGVEIKVQVRSLKVMTELTLVHNKRFYRPETHLDEVFPDKLSQYREYCLPMEEEFKLQTVFMSQIKMKADLERELKEGRASREAYEGRARSFYDIYINPNQAIDQLFDQRRLTIFPPPLTKREVFQIARDGHVLPVHSTRHTFDSHGPVRVFGTIIPIQRLKEADPDELTREVHDQLYSLPPEEIHWYPRGVRLDREYRHPVIIFNVSRMEKNGKEYGLLL